MKLAAGIIGIGKWEQFTLPAYESLKNQCEIVVIDNSAEPPYPFGERIPRTSYAAAINYFVGMVDADWYLALNNDVLCTGKINLDSYNPLTLYGNKLREQNGVRWIDAWCLLFSKQAFSIIGGLDEKFLMGGFEDADFCIRAAQKNINVELGNLPFVHLADSSRWKVEGYDKQRERNIAYLYEKHGVHLDASAKVIV
jgi:hypothetical protein